MTNTIPEQLARFNDEPDCGLMGHDILALANELARQNEVLYGALRNLLDDTQHKNHDCGDEENCPVLAARKALSTINAPVEEGE